MATPVKVIYLREGFVASIVSDIFTFGMLIGSTWFNHHFIGGNYFVNAIILVMFVIMLISKTSQKWHCFYSLQDLRDFLDKEAE